MCHKLLVGQFFLHASQEALKVFQLCLLLFNFGSHVDAVAQRHCKLVGAHHEGRCCSIFFVYHVNGREVCHLHDDGGVSLEGIFAHHLQHQCIFVSDVFLVAHGAHAAHNLFYVFYGCGQRLVVSGGSLQRQFGTHNAFALFAVVDVLPQLFGDEGHEGVQ